MTTNPVRFDRLQWGLISSVAAAMPDADVVWKGQAPARGARRPHLASIRVVTGPDSVGLDSLGSALLPLTATITVDAAVSGSVLLRASGLRFPYTLADDDDAEAVRDGLISLTEAEGVDMDVAVAPSGSDALTLTATALGDLYGLSVSAGLSGVVTTSSLAHVQVDTEVSLVEVDVTSTDPTPMGGALRQAKRWTGQLFQPSQTERLAAYGMVALQRPKIIPAHELAGPDWNSRAVVRARIQTRSLHAEAVDYTINTVSFSLSTAAPSGSDLIEATP